jgi:hypothetical protein
MTRIGLSPSWIDTAALRLPRAAANFIENKNPNVKQGKMSKSKSRSAAAEVQDLVKLYRRITEEQFDFWLSSLNRAVAKMGGTREEFTDDDRQKTISYWYLLMSLLEIYAAANNPFAASKTDSSWSEGLTSMEDLTLAFADRFKAETVRRYVTDLKRCRLVALDGRGPNASVKLSTATVFALTDTMRHWTAAFEDVQRRSIKLGIA